MTPRDDLVIPPDRAVRLAGVLAEHGVTRLILLIGSDVAAAAASAKTLDARATDLPGELRRAGHEWTLRDEHESFVIRCLAGELRVTRDHAGIFDGTPV